MPVQPDEVDGRVVVAVVAAAQRTDQQPADHAHTNDNVNAVQPGHDVVDGEEAMGVRWQRGIEQVRFAAVMDMGWLGAGDHHGRGGNAAGARTGCEDRRLVDWWERGHRNRNGASRWIRRGDGEDWIVDRLLLDLDCRSVGFIHGLIEGLAPLQVLVELVGVLEVLDDKEADRTCEREREADREQPLLVGLRGANADGHREARQNQHAGVDAAEDGVEVLAGVREDLRILEAQDRVHHEQRAEEQHFGGKEHPHAELARVELLRGGFEVVREERVLRVLAMRVMRVRVGRVRAGGRCGVRHDLVALPRSAV